MTKIWTLETVQSELDASPAIASIGVWAVEIAQDERRVVMKLPMSSQVERLVGTNMFHGGPIASFIDTAGDFAVALAVGGGVPTMNLRVDYLRPCVGEFLTAVATARRVGRTTAVADVDVFDSEERLCAVGRGAYSTKVG